MFHKVLFSLLFLYSSVTMAQQTPTTQIAFLADVHLQDIYGSFSDTDFNGIVNPNTGKPTILRTMASQLHSTRIFNENYFAFITALEDIAKRNIHLVALPGDYSDDGQPIHIKGLSRILHQYEKAYNIQFFITTGNHDPVGPFLKESGKNDFLGEGGKAQPIFSTEGLYTPNKETEHPTIITKDIAKMGYDGILKELGDFGFFPREQYTYWATPFSDYSYETYTYKKAQAAANLDQRTYEVAPGFTVPDVSYVVEPVPGIWLLAIDGDVYLPKNTNGNPADPHNYHGASTGYNNVLTNKKHLINWAKKVAAEAKKHNKTLITFSHFPMVDFNDDASATIAKFMGSKKWQLERVPDEAVAQAFADAGITIHIAGHMHINDTGIRTTKNGHTLVNIQSPSLAAYIPGYKILTLHDKTTIEVETVTLDSVPHFDELFPMYETEHEFLNELHSPNIWNMEVLESDTYHDFMLWHLKELVRLRFINDWPEPVKSYLQQASLEDIAQKVGLSITKTNWTGTDVIYDFYKLRNADVLALQDIPEERLKYYRQLILAYKNNTPKDTLEAQLQQVFYCIDAFLNGAPAQHFKVNLETGEVTTL
ncbi:metallophosphoesterase [Neptunitalea chrysea]|uniref:Metallophosphoesterase n=1 Tax=Neptunitalea chrysea TaxID=1647581 RepID=A0A9W6B4S3_9FLAO|nr:metallophosphoesterase [Neptunitalea chrysea]GLB52554.1 metallophosphoesterase [Neptunitalea chrysea]